VAFELISASAISFTGAWLVKRFSARQSVLSEVFFASPYAKNPSCTGSKAQFFRFKL